MNTRNKMYKTNKAIKDLLISKGFHHLYLFPHLRFIKDYNLDGLSFDAMGWKKDKKRIYLFQFKTNVKPTKKILNLYKKIEKKYYVKCLWITRFDRGKIEVFEGK